MPKEQQKSSTRGQYKEEYESRETRRGYQGGREADESVPGLLEHESSHHDQGCIICS